MTAREAAEYLGLTLSYLYKLTSAHRVPFYCPMGRKILFKQSELEAFVEATRVPTDAELSALAEKEVIRKGA